MKNKFGGATIGVPLLTVVMLLSACSGGDGADSDATTIAQSEPDSTNASTTAPPASTTTTSEGEGLEVVSDCVEADAEVIAFDSVTEGEVTAGSVFYCMVVPEGLSGFTVTLTGLTANADLYMGYGSLETVKGGGFEGTEFWYSDEEGIVDDVIVVDPTAPILRGVARPGAYYIEVLGEPTPFTLQVAAS